MDLRHVTRVGVDVGGEEFIVVSPDLFGVAGWNQLSEMMQSCCETPAPGGFVKFFVDYSPQVFQPLVDWLRHFRDSDRDQVVEVVVDAQYRAPLVRMMLSLSFDLHQLRLAGIKPGELADMGYSYESLVGAGFQAAELLPRAYIEARHHVVGNVPWAPAKPPNAGLNVEQVLRCISGDSVAKVLRIDIGGQQKITVSRDLFSVAGENRLARMAAEDHAAREPHSDADVNCFVDYSPRVFLPLVDWLRRFRDSQRDRVLRVLVDQPYRLAFIRMMMALSFELWYLRLADIKACELLERGISTESLLDAGFQEMEMPDVVEVMQINSTLQADAQALQGQGVFHSISCTPQDVIRINMGGQQLVAVSAELLSLAGENKLSVMVSGRWEAAADPEGSYFVDYSPEVFFPLVDWLRHFRDSSCDQVVAAVVDKSHRPAWIRMMIALSFELRYLRLAGIEPIELLNLRFSEEMLLDAGFQKGQGCWEANDGCCIA